MVRCVVIGEMVWLGAVGIAPFLWRCSNCTESRWYVMGRIVTSFNRDAWMRGTEALDVKYFKSRVLRNLRNRHLNIFDYVVFENGADLVRFHIKHRNFTVRFSREDAVGDLPFFVVTDDMDAECVIGIGRMAEALHCGMVVSKGVMVRDLQVANFVFRKERCSGRFLVGYCTDDCTLREMYERRMAYMIGTVDMIDGGGSMSKFGLGITEMEHMLGYIARSDIYDMFVDCILYADRVGILNDYVIVQGIHSQMKYIEKDW